MLSVLPPKQLLFLTTLLSAPWRPQSKISSNLAYSSPRHWPLLPKVLTLLPVVLSLKYKSDLGFKNFTNRKKNKCFSLRILSSFITWPQSDISDSSAVIPFSLNPLLLLGTFPSYALSLPRFFSPEMASHGLSHHYTPASV